MEEFDTIIRGGNVVDGTGAPAFRGDVAVRDGRIAQIARGEIRQAKGTKELDATGLNVVPGFIDLHTHYDAQINWDPYCTISGWHGVTTVAMGNCGFGFAPVRPAERDRAMLMMTRNEAISYDAMKEGMEWDWTTFPEWMDVLEHRIPKGVNCAMLVPMSPLLVWVMGLEESKRRHPNAEEMAKMQALLAEGMSVGACGWSTQRLGKNSPQGDYDGTPMATDMMAAEDVLKMGEVLAKSKSGFIEITYNSDVAGSFEESISSAQKLYEDLARVSGRNLLYNVIPIEPLEPDLHRHQIEWINRCQAQGLNIYGQGANVRILGTFQLKDWNLWDYVPEWKDATLGTTDERKAKLADPARRAALVASEEMISGALGLVGPIVDLEISGCGTNPALQQYVGRTIGQVAREQGKSPVDAMLDLSVEGDLKVEFRSPISRLNHDANATAELFDSPYVLPGVSDGGAHTKFFTGGSYATDALAWLVRDAGTVTLENAHYHLSNLPAQVAGFEGRGVLQEGAAADIVVYDLDELKLVPEYGYDIEFDQPAGEWRRVTRAEGYRWTMVNGGITFEDGKCTDEVPGRLLRHGK